MDKRSATELLVEFLNNNEDLLPHAKWQELHRICKIIEQNNYEVRNAQHALDRIKR